MQRSSDFRFESLNVFFEDGATVMVGPNVPLEDGLGMDVDYEDSPPRGGNEEIWPIDIKNDAGAQTHILDRMFIPTDSITSYNPLTFNLSGYVHTPYPAARPDGAGPRNYSRLTRTAVVDPQTGQQVGRVVYGLFNSTLELRTRPSYTQTPSFAFTKSWSNFSLTPTPPVPVFILVPLWNTTTYLGKVGFSFSISSLAVLLTSRQPFPGTKMFLLSQTSVVAASVDPDVDPSSSSARSMYDIYNVTWGYKLTPSELSRGCVMSVPYHRNPPIVSCPLTIEAFGDALRRSQYDAARVSVEFLTGRRSKVRGQF